MSCRTYIHEVHKRELDNAIAALLVEIEDFSDDKDEMDTSRPKMDFWENWEAVASSCAAFAERVKYLRQV